MALGGLLDRVQKLQNEDHSDIIKKDIRNGNLIVKNVPHAKYPNGFGPDGKDAYLPSHVVYNLTIIFNYMIKNKRLNFNFEDLDLIR
ncbi:hypothetical protein [Halalkalibacter lacteus]|uniref:hypothetical protein n=1 Tax=Halalkalibacter lacteus TaxID=3090663 RepID=UPI002FCA3C98